MRTKSQRHAIKALSHLCSNRAASAYVSGGNLSHWGDTFDMLGRLFCDVMKSAGYMGSLFQHAETFERAGYIYEASFMTPSLRVKCPQSFCRTRWRKTIVVCTSCMISPSTLLWIGLSCQLSHCYLPFRTRLAIGSSVSSFFR